MRMSRPRSSWAPLRAWASPPRALRGPEQDNVPEELSSEGHTCGSAVDPPAVQALGPHFSTCEGRRVITPGKQRVALWSEAGTVAARAGGSSRDTGTRPLQAHGRGDERGLWGRRCV